MTKDFFKKMCTKYMLFIKFPIVGQNGIYDALDI